LKTKLLYIVLFIGAFIIFTGIIFILNEKYVNIFQFDFRDQKEFDMHVQKMLKEWENELRKRDSITSIDSLKIDSIKIVKIDSAAIYKKQSQKLSDSLQALADSLRKVEIEKQEKELAAKQLEEVLQKKKSEEYQKWLKETVKIIESMDIKKAARLISNYEDEVARDIIYRMNKRKAAQILASMEEQKAVKLTRGKNEF